MSQTTYLQPKSTAPLPQGLTLIQFIQTVLVGVSALPASLIRPAWQTNPPKQPDIFTNWLAFRILQKKPDANGYVGMLPNGDTESQRNEDLIVKLSFYGPDSSSLADLVQDGFQIPDNRQALTQANMAFVASGDQMSVPDLVNERWVERIETEIILRRQIQRIYPILSFISAGGVIHTVIQNSDVELPWQVNPIV